MACAVGSRNFIHKQEIAMKKTNAIALARMQYLAAVEVGRLEAQAAAENSFAALHWDAQVRLLKMLGRLLRAPA